MMKSNLQCIGAATLPYTHYDSAMAPREDHPDAYGHKKTKETRRSEDVHLESRSVELYCKTGRRKEIHAPWTCNTLSYCASTAKPTAWRRGPTVQVLPSQRRMHA